MLMDAFQFQLEKQWNDDLQLEKSVYQLVSLYLENFRNVCFNNTKFYWGLQAAGMKNSVHEELNKLIYTTLWPQFNALNVYS